MLFGGGRPPLKGNVGILVGGGVEKSPVFSLGFLFSLLADQEKAEDGYSA
jgi:hypothetical protein